MSAPTRLGPPADDRGYQPALQGTLNTLLTTTAKLRSLDPVTTELVRIRNGRFQKCNY